MRNSSFFEKLTGSLRLSEDDLKALNNSDGDTQNTSSSNNSKVTSSKDDDEETIIEEVDGDFVVPEGAEVETIEEVIEDDTIDTEQVEEYYEEIIHESPKKKPAAPEVEYVESKTMHSSEDYPVFNLETHHDDQKEDEDENMFDLLPPLQVEKREQPKSSLPIDMYELHHEIIIRILVPGITPEHLKVSITRDHVSISGTRPAPEGIPHDNYFEREVEWGEFSRMIHLPVEVDVEHAEAVEKYGLLIIRLPKIDSLKTQELKIKSV